MARSRSLFELTNAIATAGALAREEKKPASSVPELAPYDAKDLVSFQIVEAPAPPAERAEPPPAGSRTTTGSPSRAAPSPGTAAAQDAGPPSEPEPEPVTPPAGKLAASMAIPPPPPSNATTPGVDDLGDGKRGAPKLPDLSNVVSPIVRCEQIVAWIAAATGGTGVFMADSDGLPVAGDIQEAEARISASGLVASSIATLLQALPGEPSPLFEVHIGEGPYFQLIGFRAGNGTYVVGLWRATPLSPRQAHAVRLACRHAFGESLGGAGTRA